MARPDGRSRRRTSSDHVRTRLHRDGRRLGASCRSARPACCAPRASTRTCRVGCEVSGKGWVTAEYSMLPGASPERIDREAAKGKQSGRTVEIQRLIGRSLRAACDMKALGERQVDRRLRRAAGRRRHPHGEHLRRLHRPARRARACGAARRSAGEPAAFVLHGDQRRHRRRHAGARPAVRRGQPRRGRHERGDAPPDRRRRGAVRRGAGHGRRDGVQPGATRRARWRSPRVGSCEIADAAGGDRSPTPPARPAR